MDLCKTYTEMIEIEFCLVGDKNRNINDHHYFIVILLFHKFLFIYKQKKKLILSVLFHLICHPFCNAILMFLFWTGFDFKSIKDEGNICSCVCVCV